MLYKHEPGWVDEFLHAPYAKSLSKKRANKLGADIRLLLVTAANLADEVNTSRHAVPTRVTESAVRLEDAIAQFCFSSDEERPGPKSRQHYDPQESPTMYPLELTKNLHICLWDETGSHKYTVAYFGRHREGYELHFVGDRPLEPSIDWNVFREIVRQGQNMADARFRQEEEELSQ